MGWHARTLAKIVKGRRVGKRRHERLDQPRLDIHD